MLTEENAGCPRPRAFRDLGFRAVSVVRFCLIGCLAHLDRVQESGGAQSTRNPCHDCLCMVKEGLVFPSFSSKVLASMRFRVTMVWPGSPCIGYSLPSNFAS